MADLAPTTSNRPARAVHLEHAKQFAAYLAVRLLAMLFDVFPIEVNLRTARLLGWVWFHMPGWIPMLGRAFARHRTRAADHIRFAYGDALAEPEVRRIARESMQNLAMMAVEVLQTPRIVTLWTWSRHITLVDLAPAARILLRHRGCIMVTPHYGSFELLGYTLALVGFPIVALMRPFDNEYLTNYLLDRRKRSGIRLLFKKGAMAHAEDVIRDGDALCFIADQDAGRKGVFVDFFGRKASTYKSIGLLAMAHRVPIIVGCARRIGRRFRYEICVNRIIEPQEWDGRDDELRWITQEFSTAMEQLIRAAPEQYLWIHRRWKTRPKNERGADGPPSERGAQAP